MTIHRLSWSKASVMWKHGYLQLDSLCEGVGGVSFTIDVIQEDVVENSKGTFLKTYDNPIVRYCVNVSGVRSVAVDAENEVTLLVQEIAVRNDEVLFRASNGTMALQCGNNYSGMVEYSAENTDRVVRHIACCLFDYSWEQQSR